MASNEKNYCVYIHRNKNNGKVYIGQTCQNPLRRWGQNGCNYARQEKFYHAIQKYGWDNFEHIILYTNLTKIQADSFEKALIKKYDAIKNGYNLQEGGSHATPSEETRKKMSLSHKGKKPSEIQRLKQSQNNLGKHNFSHTDEAKEKMKKKKYKKVLCINTGEIFNSIEDAEKWCGLKPLSNIGRVCKGERKSAGKHPLTKEPLKWRFVEEEKANGV